MIVVIAIYIFLAVVFLLCVFEVTMFFLVRHPAIVRLCSRKLQNSIGYLYIQGDRKIMQFQEGCGQYHPELGYTLKPGKFVFSEIEFSNEYGINSLGVRDSEESLASPEIVILGDSFALGWGVDQSVTFAKQLEVRTKRKTLNTAIPSYGTVREMLMLRKLDRSRLKCLIIQYCGDDYDENKLFYTNENRPQIMRAETFKSLMDLHSKAKPYFFGKYVQLKFRKKVGEWKPKSVEVVQGNPLNDVDLFIHVLKQNADMLAGLPIIVFEMNGINQTNAFTTDLKKKVGDPGQPLFIRDMTVFDMSQYLEDKHFYVLDGHLNNAGHEMVTDVLCQTISRKGI